MKTPQVVVFLVATVFASAGLAAQDANVQQPAQPFAFRQGQTVYIAAYHTIEHFTAHALNTIPPTNIVDSHLPAELSIRKEFDKRHVYKLMNQLRGADFVFLVVIHDNAAEGMALAPEVFSRSRNRLDIEALREAAYARSMIGPLKIHNLGRLSDRLVQKFHEEIVPAAKTNR